MKNLKVLAVSVIVYVGLIINSAALLFFMNNNFYIELLYLNNKNYFGSIALVLIYAVFGGISVMGSSVAFFGFIGLPLFVVLGVIFAIIKLNWESLLFARIINVKWRVFFAVLFLPVIAFMLDIVSSSNDRSQEEAYASEYNRKYEFNSIINSDAEFIYSSRNFKKGIESIIVSKIDGSESRVLNTLKIPHHVNTVGFISPKGSFFVKMHARKGGNVLKMNDLSVVMNTCFLNKVNSSEQEDKEELCPDICKWSFDEKYLACQYEEGNTSLRVFNIESGKAREIYSKSPIKREAVNDSVDGVRYLEGFSWKSDGHELYFDVDRKINILTNIDEATEGGENVDLKIRSLEGLRKCSNVMYFKEKLYCYVAGDEIGIDTRKMGLKIWPGPGHHQEFDSIEKDFEKNPDNVFIIAQNVGNEEYGKLKVVNNAPLREDGHIYPIDDKYILYSSGVLDLIFIDKESGRFRDVSKRKGVDFFIIKDDEKNIFYPYSDFISNEDYAIPVLYAR